MFDRVKYKSFAKQQLSGRYSIPVIMIIFTWVVSFLINIPVNSIVGKVSNPVLEAMSTGSFDYLENVVGTMGPSVYFANVLQWVVILIDFVFTLATIHVYLKMSRSPDPVKFGTFIEGFASWGRAILCGLWQTLFIFLWTLLTILLMGFMGIVKYYSYSMMFFLVDEFPELTIRDAMKISKKMTKGHKFDLFILDLSFIGWGILCLLTFGILSFYVTPYYNMTKVNAYHAVLKEAVEKGVIKVEDLKMKSAGESENTESASEKQTAETHSITEDEKDSSNSEDVNE